MTWPTHYPDRPAIPYDPTPHTDVHDMKRSVRKLAEAGYRKGRPVRQIPHYGRTDDETPTDTQPSPKRPQRPSLID